MSAQLVRDRGNRVSPKRSDRIHSPLVILLDRLEHLLASEILPRGETLLDYGCGNKPYRDLFLKKFSRYVGADFAGNSDADILIDKSGRVDCEDTSFDCVLSSQVLEHVGSPQEYLAEAQRILKPGGSLILSTHGIWPYHPDPTDYWRWTADGLQAEIERAGFQVLDVQAVMGAEGAALQLWQDSTFERLPRFIRPAYFWFFQTFISLIESRRKTRFYNDAMIFVVLARKPAGGPATC
jgi:SAM-dependent methyltransferase